MSRLPSNLRALTLQSSRVFSTTRTLAGAPPSDAELAVPTPRQMLIRPNYQEPQSRERLLSILQMKDRIAAAAAPKPASPTEEFTPQELYGSQLRFHQGEVYAPNDLTMEELRARRYRRRPAKDAFDVLGINPLSQYKNYNLLAEYVTSMGRIMHSRDTGLRPVNQRRMAKAIRRAVGIGFLPSTHRHPEILKNMEDNMSNKMNSKATGWR